MLGGIRITSEWLRDKVQPLVEVFDPEQKIEVGDHVALEPCVPQHFLDRIREETKGTRACPYVALDDQNQPAAAIVSVSLTPHTKELIPLVWETEASGLDAEERRRMLGRVRDAMKSPAVLDVLYPKRRKGGDRG